MSTSAELLPPTDPCNGSACLLLAKLNSLAVGSNWCRESLLLLRLFTMHLTYQKLAVLLITTRATRVFALSSRRLTASRD